MDRASGSGVFARDPDALLDLIELEVSDDLRKQVSIHAPARGATVIFKPRKNHAVSDMISRTHLFKYCEPPSNVSNSARTSHFSSGANSPEKTCTLPVRTYTISIPSGS